MLYSNPTALAQAAKAQFRPPVLCKNPKIAADRIAPRLQNAIFEIGGEFGTLAVHSSNCVSN